MSHEPVLTPGSACLNCSAALTGPYCAQCGQHVTNPDLTIGELVHEATHELTHVDGKLVGTLKTLFSRPGQLTVDALAGRRARWLTPLRTYLICSVAFFFIGPVLEHLTHRASQSTARFRVTDSAGRPTTEFTPEIRQQLANGLPARVFGFERLERIAKDPERLSQQISSSRQQAMFVLLPLFAGLTWMAWRRRRLKYPAHLYLALHLHAAWFAVFAVIDIVAAFVPLSFAAVLGVLTLVYILAYSFLACRRVFGGSWKYLVLRSLVVFVGYSLCWLVTSFLLLAVALFMV